MDLEDNRAPEIAAALRSISTGHALSNELCMDVGWRRVCSLGADLIEQIAALQSENAELKKRLDEVNDFEKSQCAKLLERLSRVEAERDAAISDVPHDCEHCKHAMGSGACKLLPDGDQFSPDYTESFDRDGNCDHWEWRGAQGEG